MFMVCSDLEGVYTPEIWINVAKKTGIEELSLTTRDIPDYDVLMKKRLSILERHSITLADIQAVIRTLDPLEGALEFLNWLRSFTQIIVVSDTFSEFAGPLMEKLGHPTLFCHNLTVDGSGMITGYNIRQEDSKRRAVQALKGLNYSVVAVGDSYNDVTMLAEADRGILFRPPENVAGEFPDFPVTTTYDELRKQIQDFIEE